MSTNTPDVERLQAALRSSLQEHWALFLAEGILLLVLGLAAFTLPALATFAVEVVVGWAFLLSGVLGLVASIRMRSAPGFGWALVSALLGIVAGVMLLLWPLGGVLSLTAIVISFLAIEGVVSILYALDHRRERSGRWGWMLASGVLDVLLAGFLLAGLPGTAAWAIGLLVGINMVFGGVALIAMALHARALPSAATARPS